MGAKTPIFMEIPTVEPVRVPALPRMRLVMNMAFFTTWLILELFICINLLFL